MPNEALQLMLKDKKKYSDDVTVNLGNGESIKLGDLRSWAADAEGQAEARRRELDERFNAVTQAESNVSQLYAQLQEKMAALGTAPPPERADHRTIQDPLAVYDNNEDMRPLVNHFREVMRGIAMGLMEQRRAQEAFNKIMQQERFARQYNEVLPRLREVYGEGEKIPTIQDLVAEAGRARYQDEFGFPDISKPAENIYQARREQRALKAAEQAEAKAKEAERRAEQVKEEANREKLVSMPRPGVSPTSPRFKTKESVKINPRDPFGAAMEAAANDPEVWKAVQ